MRKTVLVARLVRLRGRGVERGFVEKTAAVRKELQMWTPVEDDCKFARTAVLVWEGNV